MNVNGLPVTRTARSAGTHRPGPVVCDLRLNVSGLLTLPASARPRRKFLAGDAEVSSLVQIPEGAPDRLDITLPFAGNASDASSRSAASTIAATCSSTRRAVNTSTVGAKCRSKAATPTFSLEARWDYVTLVSDGRGGSSSRTGRNRRSARIRNRMFHAPDSRRLRRLVILLSAPLLAQDPAAQTVALRAMLRRRRRCR